MQRFAGPHQKKMENAVQEWFNTPEEKRGSINGFCERHEISRTTFLRWIKEGKPHGLGRHPVLSQQDKEQLVELIYKKNCEHKSLGLDDLKDILLCHGAFSQLFVNGEPSRSFFLPTLAGTKCWAKKG